MRHIRLLLFFYSLLLLIYSLFTYSLTSPNLVLSSWQPFWQFQTYMWETFFNNRPVLTSTFVLIVTFIFLVYFLILSKIKAMKKVNLKVFLLTITLMAAPLLFSNNALSYDVFNYIFNAKMIVTYNANPHSQVALDFAYDPWVRFMHNTHTSAPYGYGWTALSLLPYSLGFGKFLPTWIIFRLFSFLSYLLLAILLFKNTSQKKQHALFMVLLNPLLLIEVISNSHNDLWMLVPGILSLLVLEKVTDKYQISSIRYRISDIGYLLISFLLLAISISIKLATVVLMPFWLFLIFHKQFSRVQKKLTSLIIDNRYLIISGLLFIPLFTGRSKQFLAWYLIWSFIWIPLFAKNKLSKIWASTLMLFSITALFSYLPFLYYGEYFIFVNKQRLAILWIIPSVFFILSSFRLMLQSMNAKKSQ